MFKQGQDFFYQQTGDPVASQKLTLGALEQIRDQQALSLSYFDVFWACAALAVFLVFLGAADAPLGALKKGRILRRSERAACDCWQNRRLEPAGLPALSTAQFWLLQRLESFELF